MVERIKQNNFNQGHKFEILDFSKINNFEFMEYKIICFKTKRYFTNALWMRNMFDPKEGIKLGTCLYCGDTSLNDY